MLILIDTRTERTKLVFMSDLKRSFIINEARGSDKAHSACLK